MQLQLTPMLLLLLLLAAGPARGAAPEVSLTQGKLVGRIDSSAAGQPFHSFQGIPYALPPVGELRFKRTAPAEGWTGTRDATAPGNMCPQFFLGQYQGDEDCLFLNVYTPKLPSEAERPLDVMVWIHGGAFLFGSGNPDQYGPGYFMDENVVLVTLNYRLGALGFLSTDDDEAWGNYGLYDQNMALLWVQQNIAAFGGDPSRVTIFGESAGGTSVHYQIISPLSRGLFGRAISQSATALVYWANGVDQRHVAERQAAVLDCPTDTSRQLVDCLRAIPAKEVIMSGDRAFKLWSIYPATFTFRPNVEPGVEGAFLPDDPRALLDAADFSAVPWIAGVNHDEGGTFANFHLLNASALEELRNKPDEMGPLWLGMQNTAKDPADIYRRIKNFYFGDQEPGLTTAHQFNKVEGDRYFLTGVDAAVRAHARANLAPVYKYVIEQAPSIAFPGMLAGSFGNKELQHFPWGTCHFDDIRFLFTGELFPDDPTDKKFARALTNIWANFAKTGRPTTNLVDLPEWEPYSEARQNHMRLSLTPAVGAAAFQERVQFWHGLELEEGWRAPRTLRVREGGATGAARDEL
ncbi:esterase E4-like [Pollicipes pollicipes]|uniref:esterase E4-like n=1 Tax=Pollicipes pollicipes TaxID=41117 RepID=UPI00188500C0|nr:esterase E4-like [Pollicipes pollicipes]